MLDSDEKMVKAGELISPIQTDVNESGEIAHDPAAIKFRLEVFPPKLLPKSLTF